MTKHLSLRVLVFTLWFALMQAFAPFLHAHFGENAQAVDHGPHLHLAKVVELGAGVPLSDKVASSHSALDWHTDISTPQGHILDLNPAIASKKVALNNAELPQDASPYHALAFNIALALFVSSLLCVAVAFNASKRKRRAILALPFFITRYALRAPPSA